MQEELDKLTAQLDFECKQMGQQQDKKFGRFVATKLDQVEKIYSELIRAVSNKNKHV